VITSGLALSHADVAILLSFGDDLGLGHPAVSEVHHVFVRYLSVVLDGRCTLSRLWQT
jgi:hypothetical protein